MNQKDHILRLAVGAHRLNVPFVDFIEGLNLYTQDETAIDRQPVMMFAAILESRWFMEQCANSI